MPRRNDSVCTKVPETFEMIEGCRGLRCDWMLDCCVLIRKKRGKKKTCKESQSVDVLSPANDDELWSLVGRC